MTAAGIRVPEAARAARPATFRNGGDCPEHTR